jgi:hypothetical protein
MFRLGEVVNRRFEGFVFDWDGTAVEDRDRDASALRQVVEDLCSAGAYVAIVSGTHLDNVYGQLRALYRPPGRLVLALNRGSEIYVVNQAGPQLVFRRETTTAEEAALDAAAALAVRRLQDRGVPAEVVSQRLNRRKIDLIPVDAWADPPKAMVADLLDAVEDLLLANGVSGLSDVVALATAAATDGGLADPRITTDVKHVEIGLTDKSDSADWIFADLWDRGIGPSLVLVAGDEFGDLGGLPGSDSLMLVERARGATAISVGVEPHGPPDGVAGIGGGPTALLEVLRDQIDRRRAMEPPYIDEQSEWCVTLEGIGGENERAREALLTLSDGWLGTNGASSIASSMSVHRALVSGVYDGTDSASGLMSAPAWHSLPRLSAPVQGLRRVLDLRTAVLREEGSLTNGSSFRFEPAGWPGTGVLRAAYDDDGAPATTLLAPLDHRVDAGDDEKGR